MSAEASQGFDPAVQQLLEEGEPRRGAPLSASEAKADGLAGAAFALVAVWLALAFDSSTDLDWTTAALLTIAFALSTRVEFFVGAGYTVPTQLVFVPMLFLLPPELVPLFVSAGFFLGKLPDYALGTTHPTRAVLAFSDAWFSVGPALVFAVADPGAPSWADWPVYALALASQFAGDFAASALREWLALRVAPTMQLTLLGWVWLVDTLLAPLGLLAAFAAEAQDYAYLLVLPLLGLLSIFARERQVRIHQAIELSSAYKGTALLLGDVVEADDEYTGAHSRGVLELALEVADSMGLPAYARRQVEFSALLHDVGKINIPKEIINKPGKLDDTEWAIMKTHTIVGPKILEKVGGVLGEVGRIVRSCHERWDGHGYPDGLEGREIPVAARIVFCCDAFNAMTTTRSYRKALPLPVALEELETNAGSQFDPEVVSHITRIVRRDAPKHARESVESHGVAAGFGE
jgi:HD-GYP domain-containing protein (c-di-GMP phosphodiesterase class II)